MLMLHTYVCSGVSSDEYSLIYPVQLLLLAGHLCLLQAIPCYIYTQLCTHHNLTAGTASSRSDKESSGLSEVLAEGDVEQRAQHASAALAKAFDRGQSVEVAMQAAAQAEAAKAAEELKAERRRRAPALHGRAVRDRRCLEAQASVGQRACRMRD